LIEINRANPLSITPKFRVSPEYGASSRWKVKRPAWVWNRVQLRLWRKSDDEGPGWVEFVDSNQWHSVKLGSIASLSGLLASVPRATTWIGESFQRDWHRPPISSGWAPSSNLSQSPFWMPIRGPNPALTQIRWWRTGMGRIC